MSNTRSPFILFLSFFFNATATPDLYTLSLHDALPICSARPPFTVVCGALSRFSVFSWSWNRNRLTVGRVSEATHSRSEEHTSELQSRRDLVCRLLLEKKKKKDVTGLRRHCDNV